MPLKFDLEGALAEPASGLKFDIESALSPSVGRTPPQDQPLESDLAGIVQPRQELRQKPIGERIAGMRPAPAEIRNSPSTIYKADNPVLNAALGVPRAFVHGAEQAIQAGAGFTGNEQARKASERRVQGLMLESDFPDLEQGAGSMLAIAPAALINPAFGAAVGGGLAAGPAIGEGMEAGLSTPEAIAYGVGQGGLEYLTERIPIGILFGKGGAHVAERLVKAFFPEATGEQIATLTQDALRQSVIEPNKPWSEYWAERGEAAKRTLIATAGGLGAAGAIQAGVQRLVPQTNQFADVLDEVVRGTTIKPAGLDIVQDLYDRGRTRFANVPVQPQPELNVPSSASTLAQQPIQAAPLTAQGQATMPDEYAGPGGYAIPQGEADAIQEQIPAEVDVREQARDGEEVAIGDAEVQAPAEEGRPQEVAFDVSGRTDEQLAWLAEHGKPGWREAAIAEGERRGIAPSATTPTTAQTPQQPAPKAKKPRKTGPSNNLIRRIHQLGGINLRYLPDVAGERKVQRGMPVGLFRKNGMGLDDLSRMLADEGFPINVEDPTDIDGVRQLTELLQKTLSGGTVLNYSGQQAMLDAMAKAEAEIDVPEQATLDDPEAIAEREAIKQADIAIQGVTNDELDALLDAAFNDERTPNAILSDEEIDQLFASASDAPQTQPEGQDADSVAGSPEAESFALDAYTPEDLKQREVQPEPERPEAPSPADFVLSGSNRQADEAEARGQIALPGAYTVSEPTTDEYTHDLFGNPLPDKPRARGSRAQQQAAQTRNVDTASSVPPGQYGTTTKLITHATREIGATNVSTVDEAATALSYLGRGAVERFDALVTDKNGKPLALVGSFKGALTQTSVFPSTVIAEAFRIPGAANIWFAHNHPSGTPELSQADRWLTSQLENVFEGTGINTHGTFAITNDGRYTHTDGGRGTIKPAKSTMRLDAVEREFDKFDKLGAAFSDPAAAQTEMRVMGLKDPGLVLLDTQNAPIAFIPMGGMEAMPLKHNGRLDALYRAISYANAGAAVIYDPRGDFTEAQYRNIGAALGQVDVKLLDVFQKGVSMAEKGRALVASTLLSRGPNAAGMSVESATSLLRKRFGKRIDKMLEAGTLKIVATPAELPAWGKGQRGIGGAWDGTTAWIVASQASPETLAATYLHEVGEHAGMQEMLGDKYQDIITRLDDLIWDGDATANRAASRVPKDTLAKDEQHERLAYFIEEAQRARDSQPQTLSTKARQLLQDILAAIRAWAYRQFGGITLTEADILALARQSAKRVADRAGQAQGQTTAEAMLQKVWHGTQHIWAPEPGFPHGRPRLDKMGTGEGAQAFGWGWYSAESRGVGKSYASALAKTTRTFDGANLPTFISDESHPLAKIALDALGTDRYLLPTLNDALFDLSELTDAEIRNRVGNDDYQPTAQKSAQVALKLIDAGVTSKKESNLYQLDIPDATLPYLLDWDRPLSEQTKEVQALISDLADDAGLPIQYRKKMYWKDRTGQDFYNAVVSAFPSSAKDSGWTSVAQTQNDVFGSPRRASEFLASWGIVGNRYLDGQSRNDGKGTYNYVIWDQPTLDKIALLERNGEKLDAMREAEVQMSRTDTITVDGVDRPTTNSNGDPIAGTDESLTNFWRWFGDSAVVDEQGRPLVVHHYTDADNIESFDKIHLGINTESNTDATQASKMARLGFWFSDSDIRYTKKRGRGMFADNKIDVYLSINEPIQYETFEEMWEDSDNYESADAWRAQIKAIKDDGVVLLDDTELGGTSYIAFEPTQIKSATGNRGTFDPASPDIRFSKEPQSTDAEEMAKKFGFAIKGMADARIQPSAERAYIENQEMFERMKRGVVSNADSKKAGEALAAEVGWSPDSVDAFMKEAAQKGTPPVDILAAMFAMSRMQSIKLLEAQNPTQFIEYTMDVLRTLMATRAYGSEMGRALQFIGAMERMGGYTAADVTSEGGSLPRGQIAPPTPSQIAEQKTKAKQTAQKAKDILAKDPKLSDLVSEEAMTKALGGDNGIRKIMAAMHKQGKDVDLGMLVSYLSGMVDSIAKEQSENRSTLNKLMAMHVELWRANILTGLFTHEVNVTSNAANMLIEFGLVNPIQEMLPGGIGLGGYLDALKAMGGYRKVLTDIWALMKYSAFEEAPASRLSHLLDQRDPELLALMRGTEGSKWADTHRKFIPGLAGKVVRGAGFVPLGIEDAIFKVIPFRYELARQQAAGEQRNVTAAIDAANKLTFQDGTGMLGMVVAKMHEKAPYSEFWITFVKTMTNLIKRSFDLTPGLSQAKNWDALIGNEGDKARREAIALSIVGVGIASMVMALMGDDDDEVQLSGFAPYDRLKKLLWLEEHDNIGLRIGDEVYPFYRMSPLAEPAGLTIGAYNSIKQGEAGPLFNAMYQSIVTKHFMAKIADLIDGIEEVARAEGNEKSEAGERLVRRQLGGIATGTLIPNFIAQLGDMTDAEKREVNTIMQDLQKKIPGLRESLPSKLKVTGEVLGEPRYMSPFPVQGKPVKKDEVTRWLLKLGRGIDPNPKSIKDLPHDVRQTLLRERWEFLGYAYEASKDLDAETQEKIIRKMLSAWTENAKAARVMHELETPAD